MELLAVQSFEIDFERFQKKTTFSLFFYFKFKKSGIQTLCDLKRSHTSTSVLLNEEFDPGSGLTLAVCLIHASRAKLRAERRTGE